MTEHDALCPQRHQYRGHKSRCVCALLAAARADERATAQVQACDAHISQVRWAEAVAAKLVEVIRVDDLRLRTWKDNTAWWMDVAHIYRRERDAARAEVERLRELTKTNFDLFHEAQQGKREAVADRDLARAEVADLTRWKEEAIDVRTIEAVLQFLREVIGPVPTVLPDEDGSAMLQWRAAPMSLVVQIDAGGPIYGRATSLDGAVEQSTDPGRIGEIVKRSLKEIAAYVEASND